MRYALRPITAADRPTAVRFMGALQDLEVGMHASRLPANAMADAHLTWLETECAKADGRVELAWTDDYVAVGLLIYLVEEEGGHYVTPAYRRVGWITDIWIEPTHRGGPLLDSMIDHAATHFRDLGLERLMLSYLDGNARARTAYAKRGFTPYETIMERAI